MTTFCGHFSPLQGMIADAWRDLILSAGGTPARAGLRLWTGELPPDPGPEWAPDWLPRLDEERKRQWAEIRLPERRQEWLIARGLELALRDEASSLGTEPSPGSLGTSGKLLSSVSHTRSVTGKGGRPEAGVLAVAYPSTDRIAGVGVDLEREDRFIDPRIRSRLLGPDEGERVPDLLDAWVVKEACFKSVPDNQATLLPDYVITAWDSASGHGKARGPAGQECSFLLLRREGWVIALALSKLAHYRGDEVQKS